MPNVFFKDDQLKSHETKLKQISTELAEHRSYPPDKKLKGKEVEDYKLKDHYLEFEVCMGNMITFTVWVYFSDEAAGPIFWIQFQLRLSIFHLTSPQNMFLSDRYVPTIPEAGMLLLFLITTSYDLSHEFSSLSAN